ncbi:S41 family peptidase [Limnochorda pilosa]|uniref:Peptidase S41 n=1 Tax=Limnochorda pilosa TaxID=1555112 RepID=A0A0K2SNT2_LIMPI|nr:S41 family peptidase [Limnochorda pilosa]BAS28761.1 peptidase S41 [Limnochorda pilosa]
MQGFFRGRRGLVVLLVGLVLASGAGWFVERQVRAQDGGDSLRNLVEVIALVRTQYVEPVSTFDLIAGFTETGTINGMLAKALEDPYSRYMDPRAYEQTQIDIGRSYGGLGIYVGMKDDRLTVIAPMPGTPAQKAGLHAGDRIVGVDGQSTELMSQDEAVSLMRGAPGSTVVLEIERGGGEGTAPTRLTFRITREAIEVPSVTKAILLDRTDAPVVGGHRVGYLQLSSFSERTPEEMRRALDRLEAAGVDGLVLDLRNNPGGLLNVAIDVANMFLPGGPIVHVVDRSHRRQTYSAQAAGTYPPMPMVVLVNGFSASASEILSGALQDRGVATLVGTTTFGKGLVQTVIPLSGGAALSLTTARYQTAGGRFIHEKGIEPDVASPVDEETQAKINQWLAESELHADDPQLQEALQVLVGLVEGAGKKAA